MKETIHFFSLQIKNGFQKSFLTFLIKKDLEKNQKLLSEDSEAEKKVIMKD